MRRPRCSLMRKYWPRRSTATFGVCKDSPSRTRTTLVVLYLAPKSSGLWFSTKNCTGSRKQKTKLQKHRAVISTSITSPPEGGPQKQRRAGPKGKVPVLCSNRRKWFKPLSSTASSKTSSSGTTCRCSGNSSVRESASRITRCGIVAKPSRIPRTVGIESMDSARFQSLYSSVSQPLGCTRRRTPINAAKEHGPKRTTARSTSQSIAVG
mmetsp:Transcript_17123/g.53676  ORF Transcript_17123/g.53676 Transcript_17123/m.53676 type:complete len:209 (+) Transcript_17123:217-843(+)